MAASQKAARKSFQSYVVIQHRGHPHPVLLQLKKGGVAKAEGEAGEKEESQYTTECKSRRRRDEFHEKDPWALNYESGGEGAHKKIWVQVNNKDKGIRVFQLCSINRPDF